MEKEDKPRLAEVLGVKVGERFFNPWSTTQLYVSDDGDLIWDENDNVCFDGKLLQNIINYPESIIRLPRLTEAERAICKALGAKWVSRADEGTERVELWDVKPSKTSCGVYVAPSIDPIARVKISLFPSVKPGECISVEEAEDHV